MRKFVKNRGNERPKIEIKQGVQNKDLKMAFDDTAKIHHFTFQAGHILASETEVITITKITPEDVIEKRVKKINNSMFVYIGEN